MNTAPIDGKRAASRRRSTAILWPIIAVVLAQAAIASLSIHTVSAVRGYVGGEGLWSKGQKDAVRYITHYAETGSEASWRGFEAAIAVPLSDRDGRLALDRPEPDIEAARTGFLGGGIHPDDIDGMIWLFLTFRDVVYLKDAIARWEIADPKIVELQLLGASIRAERMAGDEATALRIPVWLAEIDRLNDEITPLAMDFSRSLGEGSRAITAILLSVNLVSATALILLALWRTRKLLEQRQAFARALNAERERALTTLSSIGQAVISTDGYGRIDYANPIAEALLGLDVAQIRGRRLGEACRILDGDGERTEDRLVDRVLSGRAAEIAPMPRRLVRRDGTGTPVSVVGAPILTSGVIAGAVIVIHDMAREQELIDRLSWQATHDELTGLHNRRAFEERLEQAIADEGEAPGRAVIFIDLDQFKIVNDTCGHAAGDALLCEVAVVLRRQLDGEDVLARLGGDEFGILLGAGTPARAAAMAVRLRDTVAELVFAWQGRPFAISASIGLVELRPGSTLEETLRDADLACYLAKEKGRNRVQVHEASDAEFQDRVGEMAWVQRIRAALDENRFVLYGQPIVRLAGEGRGSRSGHMEVLLRLRDEDGRLVSPAAFLPPAERYGLMPLIDRWVVRNAFERIAAHLAAGEGKPVGTCAINLSGATFADHGFVDFVRERFDATGIPPALICFEITETSAIAKLSTANCFIAAMKSLGCRFSLDDFGSGMSSFAYLKHLPVDYLKIDGGFVKDMLDDRIDRAMVEMIHHIGRVTGKKTVAEFVENDRVMEALREIGVDYAQGYGVAAPAPFDDAWRRAVEIAASQPVETDAPAPPLRKTG